MKASRSRLEEKIVMHSSPVLLGIKPSNLFNFSCEDEDSNIMHKHISSCSEKLVKNDVHLHILHKNRAKAQLLIYRKDLLFHAINQPRTASYLKSCGYNTKSVHESIELLGQRISEAKNSCGKNRAKRFPHEVGFFLGYPFEDVIGFIENKGGNFACCGKWKAYHNEKCAQETFCEYKKCTEIFCDLHKRGCGLDKLSCIRTLPVQNASSY